MSYRKDGSSFGGFLSPLIQTPKKIGMCVKQNRSFKKKNLQVVSEHVGFHEPLLRLFGDTGKEEDDNTPGDFVFGG